MFIGVGALAAAQAVMKKCDSYNLSPEAINMGMEEKKRRLHKRPARLRATREQIAKIASHKQRAQEGNASLTEIEKLLQQFPKYLAVTVSTIFLASLFCLILFFFPINALSILLIGAIPTTLFPLSISFFLNVYASIDRKRIINEANLKRSSNREFREKFDEYFDEMCCFYEDRQEYYDEMNKHYAVRTKMYEEKETYYQKLAEQRS